MRVPGVSIDFDHAIRESKTTACIGSNCCWYRPILSKRVWSFSSSIFYKHASIVMTYYRRVLCSRDRRPLLVTYYRRISIKCYCRHVCMVTSMVRVWIKYYRSFCTYRDNLPYVDSNSESTTGPQLLYQGWLKPTLLFSHQRIWDIGGACACWHMSRHNLQKEPPISQNQPAVQFKKTHAPSHNLA
jgi:hypothetical protein